MPQGFVYILGSTGTLYIGVTSQLGRRILQHKGGRGSVFTSTYGIHRLLYVEQFDDIRAAIAREKSLKGITRAKKLALIQQKNRSFVTLRRDLDGCRLGPSRAVLRRMLPLGRIGLERAERNGQ